MARCLPFMILPIPSQGFRVLRTDATHRFGSTALAWFYKHGRTAQLMWEGR